MKLGKIVGTVVSSQKDEKLEGFKFYLVRDVGLDLVEKDSFVVAADSVNAGIGEMVLYATGSSARQTHLTKDKPCDAVVMAIVDLIELGGESIYVKIDEDSGRGGNR